MVFMFPIVFVALVAWWYYNRSGLARGCVSPYPPKLYLLISVSRTIRLPGDGGGFGRNSGGVLDTIASIPWFLIGITGIAWEWTASQFRGTFPSRSGYRNIPVDEDAQILRFEDEE